MTKALIKMLIMWAALIAFIGLYVHYVPDTPSPCNALLQEERDRTAVSELALALATKTKWDVHHAKTRAIRILNRKD